MVSIFYSLWQHFSSNLYKLFLFYIVGGILYWILENFISHSTNYTLIESLIICLGINEIAWKRGPYCWNFRWNLKYLGWPYRAYIKTAKSSNFCEELLSENNFETVLATFCCNDLGTMASEKVQEIKKSIANAPRVLYLLNSQNIPIN